MRIVPVALLAALALTLRARAAEPALRPWNDYRTILWIGGSAYKDPAHIPAFFQSLRAMGITLLGPTEKPK